MIEGVVDWFHDQKGFGFLKSPFVQGPVFVHHSSIACYGHRTLTAGQKVYFDFQPRRIGIGAVNVYSEEMYAARQVLFGKSLIELSTDPMFVKEIKLAFELLPLNLKADQKWLVNQVLDFKPLDMSSASETESKHLGKLMTILYEWDTKIEELEREALTCVGSLENSETELARRLKSQIQSFDKSHSREQYVNLLRDCVERVKCSGSKSISNGE